MPKPLTRMLSPPQIARELGINPSKVLTWIHNAELAAINVAERRGGRARFRVSRQALDCFLAARTVIPPAPTTRRRRRRTPEITEYY